MGRKKKHIKRLGGISEEFLSFENWDYAEICARKDKNLKRRDIRAFLKECNTPEKRRDALMAVSDAIRNKTYVSSPVTKKERFTGGKWRTICTVPFYPDRIAHFAVFNIVKDRLSKTFIPTMYSYDKGIHELSFELQKVIKNWNKNDSIYILDCDVVKFYDNIDIHILMDKLKLYIKDKTVLWAIEEALTSHDAVVIGMLLSTIYSSLYLSFLDRFVKEQIKAQFYFRFADDFTILHPDKQFLKSASWRIRHFLYYEFGLKTRYANIYEISKQPLRYCGYVHYRTHTLIKKKTKKDFIKNRHKPKSVASYKGMLKWCNSKHLIYKTLVLDNGKKHRDITEQAS